MNKGYLYAFLSAILLSSSIVVNKYLLDFVNPRMLSFVWFAVVFMSSSVIIIFRSFQGFIKNLREHWKDGIIVGGFNAVAATFFFLSLSIMNAATTSFLVRFSTIFIIIIGVFFLKEKFTRYDLPGIMLAIGGALVINYSNGQYTSFGLVVALIAALGVALHQVAAKIFVKRINAFMLVNLRSLFTTIFLFMVLVGTSSFEEIPFHTIPLLIFSAGVLAVTGFFFLHKSFVLIDVSKAAIVRTTDPFIVLIIGFIVFKTLPTSQEILGGSMIAVGVTIVILKHKIKEIIDGFKLLWIG